MQHLSRHLLSVDVPEIGAVADEVQAVGCPQGLRHRLALATRHLHASLDSLQIAFDGFEGTQSPELNLGNQKSL